MAWHFPFAPGCATNSALVVITQSCPSVDGGSVLTGIIHVAGGDGHACAIADSGDSVYCWGRNDEPQVTQLGGTEAMAHLGLPRVGAELYRSARRLRVFVLRPATVPADAIVRLVMLPREEVLGRLEQERSLL